LICKTPDKTNHIITIKASVNPNSMTMPSRVVNFVRFMAPASMVNGFDEGSTISNRIALVAGEGHLKVKA
jgi:hypothetical protein